MAYNRGTTTHKTVKGTGTLEIHDAVTPVDGVEDTWSRGADGDALMGQLQSKANADNEIGVWLAHTRTTVFRRNGAITAGLKPLVVDGAGAVKLGAAADAKFIVSRIDPDGVANTVEVHF